jgi:hypothetical protein
MPPATTPTSVTTAPVAPETRIAIQPSYADDLMASWLARLGDNNPCGVKPCGETPRLMYLRAMDEDARTQRPEEPGLLAASRAEFLTPLDRFGATRHVYGRVHQAGSGVYLLVAQHLGPDDPVTAVGWARNDYWAVRVWGFDGYGYRNECDPLESAADAPSLGSLGWPHPLSYADALAHAKRLSGKPVMVSTAYRMTDGGFTSHVIRAAARVEFHYDDPNPQPGDTVAAIELGLVGDRWERHRAEIRAINCGNQPRDR